MAVTIYQVSVPVFTRHLKGLSGCLSRTQALYAEKKYDEGTLLNYRLFPDMFNFTKQVQAATNHAQTCSALLAGQAVPKNEDNEKSLGDLVARVEKSLAFLNSIKPEQLDGADSKTVTTSSQGKEVQFTGLELLQNRSMPNFFFHYTTAYNIMRHQGVEIGKRDFMGSR